MQIKHKNHLNLNNDIKKVKHIKITTYYNNQNKYIKLSNKKRNHKQIKHITLIIITYIK